MIIDVGSLAVLIVHRSLVPATQSRDGKLKAGPPSEVVHCSLISHVRSQSVISCSE